MFSRSGMRGALAAMLVLAASSSALAGDDGVWSVSKSSGDVWLTTTGAEQVSLRQPWPYPATNYFISTATGGRLPKPQAGFA